MEVPVHHRLVLLVLGSCPGEKTVHFMAGFEREKEERLGSYCPLQEQVPSDSPNPTTTVHPWIPKSTVPHRRPAFTTWALGRLKIHTAEELRLTHSLCSQKAKAEYLVVRPNECWCEIQMRNTLQVQSFKRSSCSWEESSLHLSLSHFSLWLQRSGNHVTCEGRHWVTAQPFSLFSCLAEELWTHMVWICNSFQFKLCT